VLLLQGFLDLEAGNVKMLTLLQQGGNFLNRV